MNTKVLLFGTLFLLGNITLNANEITREGMSFNEENHQLVVRKGLREELKERLVARGLDEDAAKDLTNDGFNENEILTHIKIDNYLSAISGVDYDSVMNQMATRILFNKETDLASYDTLIALTRDIKPQLINKESLEKLSHVAKVNQNLQTQSLVYM